ncbi:hypothetical protein B0H17DRAFT_1206360 [Mycena rosella]|uniref:Protein kinase domain-containing protein n=1 Tax=Mycena rosella TaxID=1033263 RepID=A0AAD7GBS6_MYCRO|nr:hypothetical protein B0H17DRAFT_1206360 [Mycena rosella]
MTYLPSSDESWMDYTHAYDLAGHEAWAYEELKAKQGLCVPYFFGLQTIITPSNESAKVLILEYIRGLTLAAVAAAVTPEEGFHEDVVDSLNLGRQTVQEITEAGFIIADIRNPNFILNAPPGAERTVVLIDLYGMRGGRSDGEAVKTAQGAFHAVAQNYPGTGNRRGYPVLMMIKSY